MSMDCIIQVLLLSASHGLQPWGVLTGNKSEKNWETGIFFPIFFPLHHDDGSGLTFCGHSSYPVAPLLRLQSFRVLVTQFPPLAPSGLEMEVLPAIAHPWVLCHPLLVHLTPHTSLSHPFIKFSLPKLFKGAPCFLLELKRIPPKIVLYPGKRFSMVTWSIILKNKLWKIKSQIVVY